MSKEYVERRGDGYYVAGTRVSLDSVVYGFLRGESAEGIAAVVSGVEAGREYGARAEQFLRG